VSRRLLIAVACVALALDAYVFHLHGEVAEMRQATAELRDGVDRLHWRLVGMRSEYAEMNYQLTEAEAEMVSGEVRR